MKCELKKMGYDVKKNFVTLLRCVVSGTIIAIIIILIIDTVLPFTIPRFVYVAMLVIGYIGVFKMIYEWVHGVLVYCKRRKNE